MGFVRSESKQKVSLIKVALLLFYSLMKFFWKNLADFRFRTLTFPKIVPFDADVAENILHGLITLFTYQLRWVQDR